ncbi:unnamed protein product [Tetraodon nigroviridis]|uniref:(spotted green pufferfish) hypothetical protein n=1 Tax=Tetraodon nigroviridis TaxID=99883 RepID=Q4RRI8_TETNG|nr:unnamed protein product [Tetraodon nigroviridis]
MGKNHAQLREPGLQLLIIPTQRPGLSKGILSHERYPAKSSLNTTLTRS